MAEYYDGDPNEDKKSESMLEQLRKYLDETPKEQLERDFFEIECTCQGIDPNDPNAKRKLNMIKLGVFLKKVLHYFLDWLCRIILVSSAVAAGAIAMTGGENAEFWFVLLIMFTYAGLSAYRANCKEWFYLRNDW